MGGHGPAVPDVNRELEQLRRDKEAAIDSQDFETAAALRDIEKRLLAEKASREEASREEVSRGDASSGEADRERGRVADSEGRSSLAEDLARLSAELDRLRSLLRERGIEPGNGAA